MSISLVYSLRKHCAWMIRSGYVNATYVVAHTDIVLLPRWNLSNWLKQLVEFLKSGF